MQIRLLVVGAAATVSANVVISGTTCMLYPESLNNSQPVNDTPSILQTFQTCGTNEQVVFSDNTFTVNSILNTTNLTVRNVTCPRKHGMAIGSLGQYLEPSDYVENVLFETVTCTNSSQCSIIKASAGVHSSGSSNGDGGGGGSGLLRNITFRNFDCQTAALPIQIAECIYTESVNGQDICNTSKIQIEDVTWSNFIGTSMYNIAASMYCSDPHPCPGIVFDNVTLDSVNRALGLSLWGTTLQDEIFQ